MRYEFLKIERTDNGKVAYLLDNERGVIVVAPVEFLSETTAVETLRPCPRAAVRYRDETDETPILGVIPRNRKEIYDDPSFVDIKENDIVEREPEPEERASIEKQFPRPKDRRSIIPSHMRGIFAPPDTPGADIETRRV